MADPTFFVTTAISMEGVFVVHIPFCPSRPSHSLYLNSREPGSGDPFPVFFFSV